MTGGQKLVDCPCRGMDADCVLCGGHGKLKDCPQCGGFRQGQTVSKEGDDTYDYSRCPKCGLTKAERVTISTGLRTNMLQWTFTNMTKRYEDLNRCAGAIRRVIGDRTGWIVMLTPPGRGKSYLMAAAINYAVNVPLTCQYITFADFLNQLQDAIWGRHRMSFTALVQYFIEVDLLCLDEAFTEGGNTDFQKKWMREILTARSDIGGWTPTLFASNARLEDEIAIKWPWLEDRFYQNNRGESEIFQLKDVPSLRGRGRL